MVQGGDPDSKRAKAGQPLGTGGPGYTVPAEFIESLIHRRGALAAARTPDNVNPQKASSGSQFYIVHGTKFNRADAERNRSQERHSIHPGTTEDVYGGTRHSLPGPGLYGFWAGDRGAGSY